MAAICAATQSARMTEIARYRFRAATMADLRFWQVGKRLRMLAFGGIATLPLTKRNWLTPAVFALDVSFGERPFAYMPDYAVHGWPQHHFDLSSEKSRGSTNTSANST